MPWANPIIARLTEGDKFGGGDEFCGCVLVCSWPMPAAVLSQMDAFGADLLTAMPTGAYVYPSTTLHCTVCTLRAFTHGPLTAAERKVLRDRWSEVLSSARSSPDWPAGPFRLRMNAPTLEGAAGIFRYEDLDDSVLKMRACLRSAIAAAGGIAAEGGQPRDHCRPIDGVPSTEPPAHLPDIIHSTVLRWAAEPSDQEQAKAAFADAAARWTPLEISVESARAVFEVHAHTR